MTYSKKWDFLQLFAGQGAGAGGSAGDGGTSGNGGGDASAPGVAAVDAAQRLRDMGVPESKIAR